MIRFASLAAALFFAFTLTAQTPPATPAAQTPPPATRPYTQLYVFGDSYSDTGAGLPLVNGPTAVAYLAQRLSIPFTYYGDPDSKGKGLNFSVSAGKSGVGAGSRQGTSLVSLGMKNQVDEFVALVHSGEVHFDPAQTLFFLAGGLNDRGSGAGYTRTNEDEEIDTLYSLGARRFMVALLPTQIPVFATAGTQINPDIALIPADEKAKHPDIRIANSDWGPFYDQVITHPAQYGITDTTTPCASRPTANGPSACATPDDHFYYVAAHPSTAAHKAVGEMLYQEALTKAP